MDDELFTIAEATSRSSVVAPFGHVLTAMVTVFDDDGELDVEGTAAVADHLVSSGCDGLVVNGTTGESSTTTDLEKEAILQAVLGAVGDRARVVAGVGSNDTAHTIAMAQAAAGAGVHGLLVVTPYYNRPPQTGLLAHFTSVADATDLPVMVYDIPGRTGTPIATDTLVRLAEHPRILAVKDAKDDLFAASGVMASTELAWYSGTDQLNLAHLTQGAVGMVSGVGHVAAPAYVEMVRALNAGDLAGAIRIHRALLPAVDAVMHTTQGAIMAKAAVQMLGVTTSRAMRAPLPTATDSEVDTLRAGLSQAGLL